MAVMYPPMYAQDGDTHMPEQKETLVVNLPSEEWMDSDHTVSQFNKRVAELLQIYGEVRVVKNGHHIDLIYKVGEQA